MRLFYSYAHEDESFRQELEKHLSALRRQGLIADWDDRKIGAGAEWKGQIDQNLEAADVILLLVSADFLTSDYCWDVEMQRALERHAQGTACVIPVILRHCDWHSAPFGKFQTLPTDARPVTDWPDRDAAWTEIAQSLRKMAQTRPGKTPASLAFQTAVVPKGLKSFDANDKGFFLQLVPGPFHADGVPESLHFWKRQIERTDADETFRVGVIYGRSGCGKSSWIKAGLLPRLENVTAVYVEATPHDTPARLLAALRKQCEWLKDADSLVDALQSVASIPSGTKLLIVLDQFEQWLHGRVEEDYGELLAALHGCDGAHVQCVLLIRSDFWDLLTRFLTKLAVRQEEGKNLAMFDLFDKRHARHVLTLFGQAYGALPRDGQLSTEQESFLTAAVDGLAEDGRIVCVRLSLFAEMLKRRDWTPATLKQLGGTSGVGFAFLEENFSSRDAPRHSARHEAAARAVLECLLPATGTDIKGAMRSEDELRQKSGYERKPEEFADLLSILNQQLRLITPTAMLDEEPGVAGVKNYQLTHDYLVPSLRDWLTAKQRESWRGRAMLLLADRTAEWQVNLRVRSLPGPLEYLRILAAVVLPTWRLARPRQRPTVTQRRVLWAATRWYAMSTAATLAVVLGINLGAWWAIRRGKDRDAVDGAVRNLPVASAANVNDLLDNLRRRPDDAAAQLRAAYNAEQEPSKKLRLAYGLMAIAEMQESTDDVTRFVLDHIAEVPPDETRLFVEALSRLIDVESVQQELHARSDPKGAVDQNGAVDEEEVAARTRYAVAAVSLGRMEAVERLRVVEGDPTARTAFIREFARWPMLARELVAILSRVRDTEVRSGLCIAVGGDRNRWTVEEQVSLREQLLRLYQDDPDSGVHGAAGWALREWQIALPDIPRTPAPPSEALADRSWFVNGLSMTMIQVPKDAKRKYLLGSKFENDNPVREVEVARFWLSDCEVTVAQFQSLQAKNESKAAGIDTTGDLELVRPVNEVTWYDAVNYCNLLSEREGFQPPYYYEISDIRRDSDGSIESAKVTSGVGYGYRLPTDVEWEVACRAGTTTEYSFGNQERELGDYGWSVVNFTGAIRPEPVGAKRPNPWGLHDMHGNVFEWCEDAYRLGATPDENPDRVVRGGSWSDRAGCCRSALRYRYRAVLRNWNQGFRVCLVSGPVAVPRNSIKQ